MKKVLLIIDTSRLTGRGLLRGAERYISAFARWEVHTLDPNYLTNGFSRELRRLDLKKYNGFLVCCIESVASILNARQPKVIHYTPKETIPGTSMIVTDSAGIGKMAAEYFLSRGFKNFAFCGFKDILWSDLRYASFRETLTDNGCRDISSFMDTPGASSRKQDQLKTWLKKLPKPVCIFACNDDRAVYILEACKSSGISVPEEIAVLGVDNDDLVCNLSSPPLSSIALDFENAGFQAARHLDLLMNRTTGNAAIDVDPVEVVTRRSTDVFAVDDRELVAAMVFIRNHYQKPIQVSDVVNATAVSRRELEYRFKSTFKKTVQDEINRRRIAHIRKVLTNSRDPIYKVVRNLEFTDPEHFSRYFKNLTGTTPSAFRQNLHR